MEVRGWQVSCELSERPQYTKAVSGGRRTLWNKKVGARLATVYWWNSSTYYIHCSLRRMNESSEHRKRVSPTHFPNKCTSRTIFTSLTHSFTDSHCNHNILSQTFTVSSKEGNCFDSNVQLCFIQTNTLLEMCTTITHFFRFWKKKNKKNDKVLNSWRRDCGLGR